MKILKNDFIFQNFGKNSYFLLGTAYFLEKIKSKIIVNVTFWKYDEKNLPV